MTRQNSELQQRALTSVRTRWQEVSEARREARFDDFMYLVQAGTSIEQACHRLNIKPLALSRQAYRWHRSDIVRYLSAASYRQKHGL